MNKSNLTIFLTIVLLLAVLVLSGCSNNLPDVSLKLSESSISIADKGISNFITATVTRTDDVAEDRTFSLVFPQELNSMYPTDVDGNRISTLKTKPLKGKNSQDVVQFKIYGEKGEADYAEYNLMIQLQWNNTVLKEQGIKIEVK